MLPKDFVGTRWKTPNGEVVGVLYLETTDFVVVEPVAGDGKGVAILINKTDLKEQIT